MIDIGRPIEPLIRARDRALTRHLLKWLCRCITILNLASARGEAWCDTAPIIERSLQRRGNVKGICITGQVVRDDDELAVAGIVL
ncbi:MAG: Uncharacterised protein [Hyphomonas sp. TMED17]|nr:MAG: Uncharacterised protein [Hyphomonas sp. TMED17]